MIEVQQGDVGKLGILFERHHVKLFNFFFRLTGERHTAEDMVQEVFVRMLKYRRSYRERGEFTAWMFTLARNVSADWFGRHSRETLPTDVLEERPGDGPLPLEQLEREESFELLRACLLKLPVDKREVLLLARSGDLTYQEIAGMLGCSVGAVKVRVHRALKHLREIYRAHPAMEVHS
jgi:RNA polymerase sigma-70 factor (ECF subfamily)